MGSGDVTSGFRKFFGSLLETFPTAFSGNLSQNFLIGFWKFFLTVRVRGMGVSYFLTVG